MSSAERGIGANAATIGSSETTTENMRRMLDIDRSGLSPATAGIIEAFAYFNAFETWNRPDEWLAGDIHVWPIIKHLGAMLIQRFAADPDGLDRLLANSDHQFSPARRGARNFDGRVAAGLIGAGDTIAGCHLFVGNHTTWKPMGGLAIQLNYDYLRQALEAVGQQTRSLMTGISEPELGATTSLLDHRSIEPSAEYMRLNFSTGRALDELAAMRDLTGFLADLLGVRGPERFLSHFNLYVSRVGDWAAAWEIALSADRPKTCFCFNYTNPLGWGLSVAARRLGIPCREIQHGIQGRMHGAYHWKHVPPGGWTTVPGERIVWSRSDFDLVDPTSRAHLSGPGSLQTIAMLLSAEASLRHPRTAQARERLLADAEAGWREFAPDGRPRVLFMSQRATDTELLAKLVADKERRYFFRFHPRLAASSGTPELAALLSSVKADPSTNLPLPVVMAGVDLVLSYSSAGFLEGRYFGLPTVFLDDYARTIRFWYTGDDLIESSVERCGADIAGLNLRPSPALPMDRLMSMVAQLPDVKQLASELVG